MRVADYQALSMQELHHVVVGYSRRKAKDSSILRMVAYCAANAGLFKNIKRPEDVWKIDGIDVVEDVENVRDRLQRKAMAHRDYLASLSIL